MTNQNKCDMIYNVVRNNTKQKLVLIAVRVHLFPSRTQKLSSLALKILGGKLPGKISRCQHKSTDTVLNLIFLTVFSG